MNKKGFMMAELVVVSSIIVISLTALYLSYNKLITSYRQVINYYDVSTLYRLGFHYQKLAANSKLESTLTETKTIDPDNKPYTYLAFDNTKTDLETGETIYMVYQTSTLENIKSNGTISDAFIEYIDYLIDSANITTDYFLIGEKCEIKLVEKNDPQVTGEKCEKVIGEKCEIKYNCKYGYLEVAND